MKKINKKKLLVIALIVFIILGIVGITNLISYAQSVINQVSQMAIDEAKPTINISFEKSNYEAILGSNIDIKARVSTKGLKEGEHPDQIVYEWYRNDGGRPTPMPLLTDQTTETLHLTKVTAKQFRPHTVIVSVKRWNDATGDYEFIKNEYGNTWKAASATVNVEVLTEINIDLKNSEDKIQGNKSDGYTLDLNCGDTYKLDLDLYRYEILRDGTVTNNKILPKQATALKWESSASEIVDVTDAGYLTAIGYSKDPVTITATVTDIDGKSKSVSIDVTSHKIPVNSIEINTADSLNISELDIEVDEEVPLTVTINPDNATEKAVTWSIVQDSSDTYAEISTSGTVIGRKIGEAKIVAEVDGIQKECTVNIVPTLPNEIVDELSSTNISIVENGDGSTAEQYTHTIHPKVLPDNATNKDILWTVEGDAKIEVIPNKDGSVSFVAGKYVEGKNTCVVTATADGDKNVTRIYNITIVNHYISVNVDNGVIVEPAGTPLKPITLQIGDTKEFTFKVNPSYATYELDRWYATAQDERSQTDVISVNDSGTVTANKEGEAYVRVSIKCQDPAHPNHVGKAYINVVAIPVTNVEIEQGNSIDLLKEKTTQLTAKVSPENATHKEVTWKSLDPSIATVDSKTGEVTAVAKGKARIVATAGGVESEACVINVLPINVDYLIMDKPTLTVKDNIVVGSEKLKVSYYPPNADNKGVKWESEDPNIVEIREDGDNGIIVPKAIGETTITAYLTDNPDIKVTCKINVVPEKIPVIVYTIDQKYEFISGLTLRLTGTESSGKQIEEKELTTNGKYDFGELTDGSYAIETILPKAKTVSNASELNIINYIKVCEFEIIDSVLVYSESSGDPLQDVDNLVLVSIVDYPNETEKENASVITGEKYQENKGKPILEAYEEYNIVQVEEIVDEVSDTNISLVANEDENDIKYSYTIHPKVLPDDATNKKLTWTVEGDAKVKVVQNEDGSVSFIAGKYVAGKNTCVITATSESNKNVKRIYNITVVDNYIPVDVVNGVTIVPTGTKENPIRLRVGESKDFDFIVSPEGATYKEDLWTVEPITGSPSNVISVNESGVVTANAVGEAYVRVIVTCQNDEGCPTHNGLSYIVVEPIPVDNVEIELKEEEGKKSLTMEEGETKQLTATVTPEDATNKEITWNSSDENVVTIDSNGNITAVGPGEAQITAKSGDKIDVCYVTVTAKENPDEPSEDNPPTNPDEPSEEDPPTNPGEEENPPEETPEESEEAPSNSNEGPKTSDIAITNYIILMIGSLIALIVIITSKKKSIKNKRRFK